MFAIGFGVVMAVIVRPVVREEIKAVATVHALSARFAYRDIFPTGSKEPTIEELTAKWTALFGDGARLHDGAMGGARVDGVGGLQPVDVGGQSGGPRFFRAPWLAADPRRSGRRTVRGAGSVVPA